MENLIKMCPDNICRTCLCESADMKSLNTKIEGEHRTLSEVLSFVVDLRIITKDKLPGQVCKGCEDIICKASTFKQRFFEVETLLQEYLEHFLQPGEKTDNTLFKQENYRDHVIKLGPEYSHLTEISIKTNVDSDEQQFTNTDILIEPECSIPIKEEDEIIDNDSDIELNTQTYDLLIERETRVPDLDKKTITCHCGEKFQKKLSHKAHLKAKNCQKLIEETVNNKVPQTYPCDICNKEFVSSRSLRRHRLRVHKIKKSNADDGKFECSQCMRQFKKKSSITNHLKQHEEKSSVMHVCQTCQREFQHKAHLDNHILSVHTRVKGFTCPICSTSFPSEESLRIHHDSHLTEKKHQCTICRKAFIMLSTLTDHMRTHTGEKPFLCSMCGKGFSQRTNLAQHVRRHQGLKPFKCEQCDRSFVSKGELSAHSRSHSGAHPFRCDECGVGLTTSSSLVKHRRTHSGERPYPCDLCPMRFAASGTLKNHRRTHTGEKPYKCNFCEKAFVQRHDLVSHIRCHTGERPYTCQCGQAFRKASALKSHVKMHSKEIGQRDAILHRDMSETMMMKGQSEQKEPVDVRILPIF